ncbi:MAG: sulfatase [Planctomycetota bacterium]
MASFMASFMAAGCAAPRDCSVDLVSSARSDQSATPSLVVISCDDMGWGDAPGFALAGFEPPTYTRDMPNVARLGREGARFRHHYSAQPVCSASRAALLTGCYPNRIGIHGALFPDARTGIAAEERTLAEMLRGCGYATMVAGKWHLGSLPEFNPLRHGFDEYYGIPYSNDMWPARFARSTLPELPVMDGEAAVSAVRTLDDQGALTGAFTARACAFIRRNAAEGRPFFAYLAHPQPHTPLAAGPAFRPEDRRALYAAVMREIDWSVGEVLRALDESGAARDTIVVFTSDNGPWLSFGTDAGSTGGLREGKGTTFEGGVRVPCLVRWPGHVPAGAASDVLWMSIDLFPTVAAIVGAPPPAPDRPIDGRDARAVWSCAPDARPTHEAFLFYYHANNLEGVRMGRWKLGLPRSSRTLDGKPGGNDGGETAYVEKPVALALYDLERDPAETTDVSADHPEVVAAIMRHVESARVDLGDALVKRDGSGRRAPGRVDMPKPATPPSISP